MNTLLESRTGPPTVHTPTAREQRRVGTVDRLALHIGLALITWGRRPQPLPASRERLASEREQRLLTLDRERAAERDALLSRPSL